MIVTDLKYYCSSAKVKTLDWLASRVSGIRRHQNLIVTDGREGYGKSTLSAADAYYLAYVLRRPLKLFFDVEALFNYTKQKEMKEEIVIWDDAALSALTTEAYNKALKNLIKLLLLARKKRNTYFINIQDMMRLKEPIVERAIGMNRVYSPDQIEVGKFAFYDEYQLRWMYEQWKRVHKRVYKYYMYNDTFPNVLYKIFDEKTYEDLKDDAILSIGAEIEKENGKYLKTRYLYEKLRMNLAKTELLTLKQKVKVMEMSERHINRLIKEGLIIHPPQEQSGQTAINNMNVSYIEPLSKTYLTRPKDLWKPLIIKSNLPKTLEITI